MALVKLSTPYKYAVGPYTEGLDHEDRIHPAGAHNPDRPYVWRVLKASHTC